MQSAFAPAKQASVLVISPHPEDHELLGKLLQEPRWLVNHADSWRDARRCLHTHPCSIVITESEVVDGTWQSVLDELQGDRAPKVIVTSRFADDHLWSEVLNLGGFNVLAKPFDDREVEWVLSHAVE